MFTELKAKDSIAFNSGSSQPQSFMNQKRYQFMNEVKKSKREEILKKRRNMMYKEVTESSLNEKLPNIDLTTIHVLEKLYEDLGSNDSQAIYASIITFRQISDTDIDIIFKFDRVLDFVMTILSKISESSNEDIQYEASKIIVNISATDYKGDAKQVLEAKLIDMTTYALKNFSIKVINQILTAFGNIVGESIILRDKSFDLGILDELIQYTDINCSHEGIWAICNLFRGDSYQLKYLQAGIPFLLKICAKYSTSEEKENAEDCLWTLVEFSESQENAKFFMENLGEMIPVCKILESHESNLVSPFLKFLSNILEQNHDGAIYFMKNGLLEQFLKLLSEKNLTIKLEVLTMLSGLISDNQTAVQLLIEAGDLMPRILYLIKADHKDVQKQGCWVICKMLKASSLEQTAKLHQLKVFETLCGLLDDTDSRIVSIVLDCIHDFLEAGNQSLQDDGENFFIIALDQLGAISKIENLQDSPYEIIRKKVVFILDNYFELDD